MNKISPGNVELRDVGVLTSERGDILLKLHKFFMLPFRDKLYCTFVNPLLTYTMFLLDTVFNHVVCNFNARIYEIICKMILLILVCPLSLL